MFGCGKFYEGVLQPSDHIQPYCIGSAPLSWRNRREVMLSDNQSGLIQKYLRGTKRDLWKNVCLFSGSKLGMFDPNGASWEVLAGGRGMSWGVAASRRLCFSDLRHSNTITNKHLHNYSSTYVLICIYLPLIDIVFLGGGRHWIARGIQSKEEFVEIVSMFVVTPSWLSCFVTSHAPSWRQRRPGRGKATIEWWRGSSWRQSWSGSRGTCDETRVRFLFWNSISKKKKWWRSLKKKHVTQTTKKRPKGKLKLTVRDGFDRMTSRNCGINKIACSQQFCM